MGTLLYVAQVCPPAHLFLNKILETLRFALHGFHPCVTRFWQRPPVVPAFPSQHRWTYTRLVQMYIDACSTGCRGCTYANAYYAQFPFHILAEDLRICHLEALNAVVARRLWAPQLAHKLVHLFSENATAVSIFQVGRGRDDLRHHFAGRLPSWYPPFRHF